MQAWSSRLAGLARAHDIAVVVLTPHQPDDLSPSTTLGSLVTVHASPSRRRHEDGTFVMRHQVHRFKPGGPPSLTDVHWRGPWGID